MRFPSSTAFALLGAGLIAISFGLARFAFGLFVPPIRADLSLSPHVIGIIGALPLISFALASLVAPWCADRLGARNTAMASGVFGVVGLALISQSAGALSLGLGVFACGICAGLMMPALTAAMQALVLRSMHGRVSSVMNAGTHGSFSGRGGCPWGRCCHSWRCLWDRQRARLWAVFDYCFSPISSIEISRILNFWIFPVTVIGKASTNL